MSQNLPPGPSYPPLLQGVAMWTRPLASLERYRARYGKRFTIRLPSTPPFVIITEPDQVKQVYTAPPEVLHPGEGAKVLEPLVGRHSVILLDGDAHMEQRKLILPAFHGERMERLTDLVTAITEDEIKRWSREPEVALHPRFQALTLEIILRAVFGLDPGPRLDEMREALASLLRSGDSPIALIPGASESDLRLVSKLPGPLKGFVDRRHRIDALIAELIAERRADGAGRDDVLSMLLEARHEDGSPMTGTELRDELMTLLVAGHETTATTLAWAFERLGREPQVLARLVDDIDAGSDEYLTATIQETLRRRPVLPNTAPRLVMEPIEVGGWRYEPGVCLVANAYLLHHDPDVYPDPYAFRPERFIEKPPGTYTWIPFGGGRRRCVGMSFAMLEMKIVVRSVLEAFALEPAGEHEPPRRRNITVLPARGSRARLRPRTVELPVAA